MITETRKLFCNYGFLLLWSTSIKVAIKIDLLHQNTINLYQSDLNSITILVAVIYVSSEFLKIHTNLKCSYPLNSDLSYVIVHFVPFYQRGMCS